jgi:acetyltransferase-like isoleucine patch superfamily enzyme
VIGQNVTVLYSTLSDSQVGDNVRIGPYTHLRGQAVIGYNCRIGNFVEIKKSTLGDRVNVAHPLYSAMPPGQSGERGGGHDHRELRRCEKASHGDWRSH